METSFIQSRQNPKVKFLASLRKKRTRDQHGCFLVEGRKELENFLAAGRNLDELFFCPDFVKDGDRSLLGPAQQKGTQLYEFSAHAFKKVSARENPDGWLGLAQTWKTPLAEVQLSSLPLLLILEGTEKPGNLGAVLRTANACGVDAVICNDPMVDLFNPTVIHSSRGLLFSIQVAVAESRETSDFLNDNAIQSAATVCEDGAPLWSLDFNGPLALVMGNETIGLSDYWREQAGLRITIPATGLADSLNLSSATAICLYETLRQRNAAR